MDWRCCLRKPTTEPKEWPRWGLGLVPNNSIQCTWGQCDMVTNRWQKEKPRLKAFWWLSSGLDSSLTRKLRERYYLMLMLKFKGALSRLSCSFCLSDFRMTLKMVSVSVRYLFYQPMDEKIRTWTVRFPAKENPNMEKALFDYPIVLQYDKSLYFRSFVVSVLLARFHFKVIRKFTVLLWLRSDLFITVLWLFKHFNLYYTTCSNIVCLKNLNKNVYPPCCAVGNLLRNRPTLAYKPAIISRGRRYNSKNTSTVYDCLDLTLGHSSMQTANSFSPCLNFVALLNTASGRGMKIEVAQITATALYASRIVSLRLVYKTMCQYRSPAMAASVPTEAERVRPWRKDISLQRKAPKGQ